MDYIALGKSNLMVSRTAFGAMSLKDIPDEEQAIALVHEAYEAGINFFDTSHSTLESEKRLGNCLYGIRQDVILSTKSSAQSVHQLYSDLEESLDSLHTDYVDLFHLEIENFLPKKNGEDGIYAALQNLLASGKIRHVGLTTQNYSLAMSVLASGQDLSSATDSSAKNEDSIFEAIQFPFNILTDEESKKLVAECESKDVGFIAMKPLYSGLVQNIKLAFGFFNQYENVIPVWGVRSSEELKQILYYASNPPVIDDSFKAEMESLHDFFN